VQAALVALVLAECHVVAQVVEAEFVVGAVGDIGRVRLVLVGVVHARPHHTRRQTQEAVQLAHLAGVAASQVVVHRDHVDTLAFQRVQVHRQRGD
jgi:hypothetical protein